MLKCKFSNTFKDCTYCQTEIMKVFIRVFFDGLCPKCNGLGKVSCD